MHHTSDLLSRDINAYLHQHEHKELLRFLTCGSVDDGKSTLIGRLLHDTKMVYEDQLNTLKKENSHTGNAGEHLDLSLLVDGLQAEREQGITIDVAYRYFSTDKRKFIIADTPGHEQYTRNMATGASSCDLAIILIDARHGVQTQTRRHTFIAALLGIRNLIVAVNKMDLVSFNQAVFDQIQADYRAFAEPLALPDIRFIPLSALHGDNVVSPSTHTPWYQGSPLITLLEEAPIHRGVHQQPLRFPVQYINRPDLNFRGYCGTLTSGSVQPGDMIEVYPSGHRSRVHSIVTYDGELEEAIAPMSVTLTLDDDIDISRGDLIVPAGQPPQGSRHLLATLVWLADTPLALHRPCEVRLLNRHLTGTVTSIRYKTDINTLEQHPADSLKLNEIACCELSLTSPAAIDSYNDFRATGAFILIDKFSHATLAAGMVQEALTPARTINHTPVVSTWQKAQRLGQTARIIELPGADATLLYSLERALFDRGETPALLLASDLPGILINQADKIAELLKQNGLQVLTNLALAQSDLRLHLSPGSVETQLQEALDYLSPA